jgi:hypothetical protein
MKMKCTVTIKVGSLMDAALIQEYLEQEKIKAEFKLTTDNCTTVPGNRKRRAVVTHDTVKRIYAERHLSNEALVKKFGVSKSTAARICQGRHVFQKKK